MTTPTAKKRRYRHTPTEWESRREGIIHLYMGEGKTADEVVETLKSVFNFGTGRRQLYKKLDEWGVRKNCRLSQADTSTSIGDSQDDVVQPVSRSTLVQLSSISPNQTTPLTPRTIESQFPPSDFARIDGSHAQNPSEPHSAALVANNIGSPGYPTDNVIIPLRLVGRRPCPMVCLATTLGTQPDNISSTNIAPADLYIGLQSSREVTLMTANNPSNMCSETALQLEQSLYQVLGFIAVQKGYISHSSAFQLKKSMETLLSLSQKVAEESESNVSGFRGHYHNLGEGLSMTKSLIASSPRVALNTYSSVDVPDQILPSRVVWKWRRKIVNLGTTILFVTEKTSKERENGSDQESKSQIADWHFGTKLLFKPKRLSSILQIEVQQYQASFGSISLPPRVVVNNLIHKNSIVFQVAERGSVEQLRRLFGKGKASLRDCNENGASLLYYACLGWNAPVCEYLIRNGLDVDEVFIDANGGETTPLLLSLGQDNLETSKALLTANADPTMEFSIGGCRASVLDKLASNMGSPSRRRPDYEIVRYLFDLASHFGVCDYRINGYRPILHNLCNAGNMPTMLPARPEDWVELFLNQGCRTDGRCSIGTCLHMFFRSLIHRPFEMGWQKALIHLVNRGADVNAIDDWDKSVSDIAYASSVCHELNHYDLGSYRGDLWDSALHACNYNIADFRANSPRVARYTDAYTREDFERLWEGRESSCPYWDESPPSIPVQHDSFGDSCAIDGMVLCTCMDEEPTCLLRTDDIDTKCRNIRDYQCCLYAHSFGGLE